MPDSKQSKEPIQLHPKNAAPAAGAPKKGKGRFAAVTRYFSELKSEFKKIIWPGRSLVIHNTIVVLVTIVVIGLLVAALDALSSLGFNALVKV